MKRLKTLDETLLEWWDFVDADPADSEAFTFVLPDGRIVKKRAVLRPIPPRRKKPEPPPKDPHFTVIVHHKHRDIVPDWMLNNSTFAFENAFRKPKGAKKKDRRVDEATDRARQRFDQGMDITEAAREAATWLREERSWLDKPGKDVEVTIYWNLRRSRK